ncbi:MAG TPA: NAD(P)H-dependent oxidoreductase [Terriglobales bacterium]|nr:NAD(P)H-dependent oxidoreductase [Terriglobales bacterium]
MSDKFKIIGICGSLRKASYNLAALKAAQELSPAEAEIEIFDLAGIPVYNQDDEGKPPARVAELKSKVQAANAVLIATPEYNYSIPGPLKNAIDWASRPYGQSCWNGKPVALMGASPGTLGTARAQYHLRQCFVFLNMYALNAPEVMISAAQQRFDASGKLTDETSRKLIRQLVERLIVYTRQLESAGISKAPSTT